MPQLVALWVRSDVSEHVEPIRDGMTRFEFRQEGRPLLILYLLVPPDGILIERAPMFASKEEGGLRGYV